MSVIKKLQETWTSNSITTLFHLGSDTSTPQLASRPLLSPDAGFSWRLAVHRRPPFRRIGSSRHKCQLFFSSCGCPGAWHGTLVNVTVSFPSHLDGDPSFCTTSIATVLGVDDVPLNTYFIQNLWSTLVSLEVSFTNPLTHSLFDMLANAGHISDALASAEEPRVPQACSALRVLEQSLKTGTSFDIVFQAYTRRLSPGKVTRPIPIYASTAVLKTTTLLLDPIEENLDFSSLFELSEGDTLPSTSIESYEYESDSDLEDNDDNHSSNHNNVAVVQPAEEVDTQAGDEASASHDERSHTPESREDTTDTGSISSFSSFEAGLQDHPDNRPSLLEDVEMVGKNLKRGSRVILVKGVAWRTWHAFIYYCYTGIANFANLRSQSMPDGVTLQQRPHCSPKSMYQLARKLQNEPLSQLAFKAIETRLSAANILDEAFSKFTSRHDAIREMEITLLLQHQSAPAVLQGLPAKIKAVAMGDLPHAALAFTALYQKITQIPAQN